MNSIPDPHSQSPDTKTPATAPEIVTTTPTPFAHRGVGKIARLPKQRSLYTEARPAHSYAFIVQAIGTGVTRNQLSTLGGIVAILLWSTTFALARSLSESLGANHGGGSRLFSQRTVLPGTPLGHPEPGGATFSASAGIICLAADRCSFCTPP